MSASVSDKWIAAQQAVLGDVLIDEKKADMVLSQSKVTDYSDVYKEIYLILQELMQEGQTIDPVVVLHKMAIQGDAGRRLIAELMDLTPTSAHCQAHIDALIAESKLYHVRVMAMRMMECQSVDDAAELVGALSELIAAKSRQTVYDMRTLLERFYDRHSRTDPVKYLPWGLRKLDSRLFAEMGDFVVLGGYPSDGKTALAISFAWAQAETVKVGFYSLETRQDKLFDRQVAMITGIPMGRIKRNTMNDGDWQTVATEGRVIYDRSMEIIPAAGMTATEIMQHAKARGYQVIYIDYIQLIRPENPRALRYEIVTQISTTLHTLASQYGIAVVGLSQLRRPDRQNRTAPKMSDLRESGQLEQDADVILLLYRTAPESPEIEDRDLIIAKNKEGTAREVIPLAFDGSTQRFSQRQFSGSLKNRVEQAGRELDCENQMMMDGTAGDFPFP